MREIVPGVLHWTAPHPAHGHPASSYWLREEGVVLNPLLPEDDAARRTLLDARPTDVLLTNRLHRRHAFAFEAARVHVPAPGLHAYEGEDVDGFDDGKTLPGGVTARQIGGMGEDEFALLIAAHRAVATADGVVRNGDGPLAFVPDGLMGDADEAAEIKRGLLAGFAALVDDVDFDHLLLAHGDPWIGGARDALRAFVDERRG